MLRKWGFFILGLVLILGGSFLAHAVQTTGGVTIRDVRFAGDNGLTQAGLLYVPSTATAAKPAPAVSIVCARNDPPRISTRPRMKKPHFRSMASPRTVVLVIGWPGRCVRPQKSSSAAPDCRAKAVNAAITPFRLRSET